MQTERLQEAKRVPIRSYLDKAGIYPVGEPGKWLLYHSPLRSDSNPSFGVNTLKNTWIDFSSGVHGDVLDLQMALEHSTLPEAIEVLLNGSSRMVEVAENIPKPKKNAVEIVSDVYRKVCNIEDKSLKDYIKKRGISLPLANKYLKQLRVRFVNSKTNPQKEHVVLGFRSDQGGWELRNSYLKLSKSPKTITTIHSKIKDEYIIWEGFFDYLAGLEYYKIDKFNETVIVLNSLSFLPVLLPFLSENKMNYMALDNDRAADEKIELLKTEGIPIFDLRHIYHGFKDFNNFLLSIK